MITSTKTDSHTEVIYINSSEVDSIDSYHFKELDYNYI